MDYIKSNAVPNKPVGDVWYNKLQLIVPLPHNFQVAEKVIVKSKSGLYDGVKTIGYRYDNWASQHGPISALYFADTEFVTGDTGTVEPYSEYIQTVVPENVQAATLEKYLEETTPVISNVDPNPGAVSNIDESNQKPENSDGMVLLDTDLIKNINQVEPVKTDILEKESNEVEIKSPEQKSYKRQWLIIVAVMVAIIIVVKISKS